MKISFIFPVYKEGKVLENILKIMNSINSFENIEIIVTVDNPTEEFLKKLKILEKLKNTKIIISKERRGKVAAVNEASKRANGDILIFLDSDVEISYIDIEKLLKDFDESDIVEFYKEIKDRSILGKFFNIEFTIYYDIILPLVSKMRRSVVMNGGGFGVKRIVWEKLGGYKRVYVEDIDFAIRAYAHGFKYKLTKNLKLKIDPPKSWRQWFDQRKRWSIAVIEILLNHSKVVIDYILKYPYLALLLLLTNPIILFSILVILIPYQLIYKTGYSFYLFLLNNLSFMYIFITSFSAVLGFVSIFLLYLIYIILITAMIEIISYIGKRKIYNPIWVILANLVYFPLYLTVLIYTVGYYIIFERPPKVNWKV